MRNFVVTLFVINLAITLAFAQTPAVQWTQTFGGAGAEFAYDAQQTADEGFIAAGKTTSFGAGNYDVYLVKTDANGNAIWTQTYGGAENDCAQSVQQTADGGYILAGYTSSYGAGSDDAYLIKTDANGDTVWTRVYGGSNYDQAYDVQQTSDGGYIVAGYTMSYGAGSFDMYLFKTNQNGVMLWSQTFGGSSADLGRSVLQTADGGYVVAGYTNTYGTGGYDCYIVKTDSEGNSLWNHAYGAASLDMAFSIRPTTDGGFILAGYSTSYGSGGKDFYLIKLDSDGATQWNRAYGGSGDECCYSAHQTHDGGYIASGLTTSFGGGSDNIYLVKTDSASDTLWTFTCDAADRDCGCSVQETSDRGYIIGGYTSAYGAGSLDIYLIRLEGEALSVTLTPQNPPVQIPATGGVFNYSAAIENNTSATINFDAWTEVILPNGAVYGPMIQRNGLNIPSGAVILRNLTQAVPAAAPPGNYTYVGKVGTYPSAIIAEDNFIFTKLIGDQISTPIIGWKCSGWDEEEKSNISNCKSEIISLSASPNPFNASTAARFELPIASQVKLAIYDISGREITVLAQGYYPAGTHQIEWDASTHSSGFYFARLTAGNQTKTSKILLVK